MLGQDRLDSIAAANSFAISCRLVGDRAGAQEHLAQATRALGADHPHTAAIRNGIRLLFEIDPPEV